MPPPADATPPSSAVSASPLLERAENFLSRQNLLIAWVVLFQLLALVYAPAFPSPFLYDDFPNIVYNEDFRADHPVAAILAGHSSSMQFDRRPVSGVITWLNYAAFGLNVTSFRAVNVVIHWLCVGALGLVAAQCARHCGMRTPGLFAALLAAVWAFHPIHSSTVIYVSQRMESLMTLFFLGSCACLLRSHPSRPSSAWWRAASGVAACLCLLSKENGAGLLVVLLVLDRLFIAGSWRHLWSRHQVFYLTLAMAWAILLAWVLSGPRVKEWDDISALASPWRYFQTECHVVFGYLSLLVWPAPLVFAPVPRIAETWADWIPYLVALVGIFGLLAWQARRRPWLWVPWVTILLVLAPTSSFIPVPLEPAFDYRMHLPAAAALALMLIAGWWVFQRVAVHAGWMLAGVAGWILALGGTSRFRAEAYARPESIWMDVVRKEPENIKAWFNLSFFLMGAGHLEEARLAAEAAHNANHVFHLPWIEAQYHRTLGVLAEKKGDWVEAETQFGKAAADFPNRTALQLGRARASLKLNRPAETLQILAPLEAQGTENVELNVLRAIALARLGRPEEAILCSGRVEQARALPPELQEARQSMRSELAKPRTPK